MKMASLQHRRSPAPRAAWQSLACRSSWATGSSRVQHWSRRRPLDGEVSHRGQHQLPQRWPPWRAEEPRRDAVASRPLPVRSEAGARGSPRRHRTGHRARNCLATMRSVLLPLGKTRRTLQPGVDCKLPRWLGAAWPRWALRCRHGHLHPRHSAPRRSSEASAPAMQRVAVLQLQCRLPRLPRCFRHAQCQLPPSHRWSHEASPAPDRQRLPRVCHAAQQLHRQRGASGRALGPGRRPSARTPGGAAAAPVLAPGWATPAAPPRCVMVGSAARPPACEATTAPAAEAALATRCPARRGGAPSGAASRHLAPGQRGFVASAAHPRLRRDRWPGRRRGRRPPQGPAPRAAAPAVTATGGRSRPGATGSPLLATLIPQPHGASRRAS